MKKNIATNWDKYYSAPYKTATYSRSITGRHLLKAMKSQLCPGASIAELGGANSCFYDLIRKNLDIKSFTVIDINDIGLKKFKERITSPVDCTLKIDLSEKIISDQKFDMVFSVGLIEHFDAATTRQVIMNHFEFVKDGGCVIISFPTPTFLYRATRFLSELLNLWIFHDERPLETQEVIDDLTGVDCKIVSHHIIWPIFLTQSLMIIKKTNEHVDCNAKLTTQKDYL